MEKFKSYIKFAFPFALKAGFSLFAVTMVLAIAKVSFTEINDPMSVVIERVATMSVLVFLFFFVSSFIYGLYKYHIESAFE